LDELISSVWCCRLYLKRIGTVPTAAVPFVGTTSSMGVKIPFTRCRCYFVTSVSVNVSAA
jgi:hypothetical protein